MRQIADCSVHFVKPCYLYMMGGTIWKDSWPYCEMVDI